MITFNEDSISSSKLLFTLCDKIHAEMKKVLQLDKSERRLLLSTCFLSVLFSFFYIFLLLTYSVVRLVRLLKIS